MIYGKAPGSFDPIFTGMQQQQQPGMVLPNAALPPPQTSVTPAFQSNGPMMPRGPVESFDYGRRDLSNGSPNSLSARASARDGIVRTGSLADRGGRPGGGSRSMYDPQRIAEQRFRQTGDPSLLFRQQYYDQRMPRGGMGLPMPGQQRPAAMPAFQPGSPALPLNQAAPPAPAAAALPPMDFSLNAPAFTMPALPAPRMADGSLDITRPLPPSTLGGGSGVPAPPMYDNKNPLPLIPSPQEVTAFGLQPDYSKPQTYRGKQYPTFTKPPAAESQRWQLYDAPGPMVPHPYLKDQLIPGPPIKRQVDPITGETRDLVEESTARGAKPAGPAAAQTDAQAPGWLDWLKGKTAKK